MVKMTGLTVCTEKDQRMLNTPVPSMEMAQTRLTCFSLMAPNTMEPMTPTALPTMGSSVSRLEFIPMPWKTPTMILRESLVSAE